MRLQRWMTMVAYATGGLMWLSALSPAWGQAETSKRVELKVVPLESPQSVVSKTDAGGANSRIASGILVPTKMMSFGNPFGQYGINVGGARLTLSVQGAGFNVKIGDKTASLHDNGLGYAPITLKTSAGRDYILAFPAGSASSTSGSLYLRSGGVVQGAVGDQVLSIYDDNIDGKYTLRDDCVRFGSAGALLDVFAPASRLVATRNQVYEIKSLAENGSFVEYSAYTGPTGKFAITCDSPDAELHVVMGDKRAQLNFVTMATAKEPVELTVVPGSYELLYGAVYSTRTHSMVALLGPGSLKPVVVAANQTTGVQLGGAKQLEFTVDKSPGMNQISVNSSKFHVKGVAGEEYRAYQWDSANVPQIYASKGATSVLVGKMSLG
jgi:hypothetical protein